MALRNNVRYENETPQVNADDIILWPILANDFRHMTVTLVGETGADQTVKFFGSVNEDITPPDVTDTATLDNDYTYIRSIDLDTGNPVDGSTGVIFSGADVSAYELNVNAFNWVWAVVTAGSTGGVSGQILLTNN